MWRMTTIRGVPRQARTHPWIPRVQQARDHQAVRQITGRSGVVGQKPARAGAHQDEGAPGVVGARHAVTGKIRDRDERAQGREVGRVRPESIKVTSA